MKICCVVLACCAVLNAETLALNSAFVKKYMNKATITATLEVDIHPNSPHSISKGGNDGDIHMAGRAAEIGLPLVAEIVNAHAESQALLLLKNTPKQKTVEVTGAWRIWFEHLGTAPQVQGKAVSLPTTSNPQHLFEIHPMTSFGGVPVLDSFVPIPKYTAYPAKTAFEFYENVPATIQGNSTAIMIESGEGKFNYTEFVMELAGKPQEVDDGYLVLASVFDSSDEEEPVTSAPRRMVFVKGTAPANQVQTLGKGDVLHVLGIPRVNLAEVFAIARKATSKAATVTLPYEMIIVAVLP